MADLNADFGAQNLSVNSMASLANCSSISQSTVFSDMVSEQKSFVARATALGIQYKDLKEKEDQFDKDDMDLDTDLTEYNTAREGLIDDIKAWYVKVGTQVGARFEETQDKEELETRTNRTHNALRKLKRKIASTSPLGVKEKELTRNHLWLNEETTNFPPELLKPATVDQKSRYTLRSMKKSLSDALANSPIREMRIRSSTPDNTQKETKKGKKRTATVALEENQGKDKADQEVDESPEKRGKEINTILLSPGWGTMVASQEQERGLEIKKDEEVEQSMIEFNQEEKEIMKEAGMLDMYEEAKELERKAKEENKLAEEERQKAMKEKEDEKEQEKKTKEAEKKEKEKEKNRLATIVQKSLARTRRLQYETSQKKLETENLRKEKKPEDVQQKVTNNNKQSQNKTKQNKTQQQKRNQTKEQDSDPFSEPEEESPSKRSRIRAAKSAAKAAAKAAADLAAKNAKEAEAAAAAAKAELDELNAADSDDEDDTWRPAMSKRKAKKLRKASSVSSAGFSDTESATPASRYSEYTQAKTLKDIQLESLVRTRMIEMRPKTEDEKFGDDGSINYYAFKNKFQSLSSVEGMNPFDALAEIMHWLKESARRVAEAYQGSDDPIGSLRLLWADLDFFYDLGSQSPRERIEPVIAKGPIRKDDLAGHMELIADLKAVKREASHSNSEDQLDAHDIVRDLINKRLAYMADAFFGIEAERRSKEKSFRMKYDNIISEVSKKAQSLKAKGITTSRPHHTHRVASARVTESEISNCHLCSASHPMNKCNKLGKMTIEERVNYLRKEGICFKCFSKEHIIRDCKAKVDLKCDQCEYKHHPILHGMHLVQKQKSEQKTAALAAAESLAKANLPLNKENNTKNSGSIPPLMKNI